MFYKVEKPFICTISQTGQMINFPTSQLNLLTCHNFTHPLTTIEGILQNSGKYSSQKNK
ncbi:hypothetical protein LC603019_01032 [Lawsonella clevelandensis]|uniref:Uncharacterized protein n=1 Tax=Lawsonella clevelandensis TaxID=1528099 RepID=A0A5E3ZY83_9ACTN|nr:hypothetical protein LC603019_01032 [Lawsonella clevelandensis]